MAMSISRRDLLFPRGMSFLTSLPPFRRSAAPPPQQPQTPTTPQARLRAALQENRLPLTMTDGPAGPGWDWLVQQARDARFTLIGEEHGVAETAQLARGLFNTLRGSGYSRMAIELSPIVAQDIEAAGRRYGLQGILDFFAVPTTWSPMYLREEAEFLAAVITGAPRKQRWVWGCEREILSERYLIARLEPKVPPRAREAFTRLNGASANGLAQQNPGLLSQQDPAVVSAG